MRSLPCSPEAMPRSSSTERSSCAMMRRASSRKRAPSAVSSTRLRLRANRATPRRCSSARMARDSGGCEMCSDSAAGQKCSGSATAMKYRISRISGRYIPIEYYSGVQIALAGARAAAQTHDGKHALDPETDTPGHTENASEFMARRTLASHGAFFVPHLHPGLSVLDCGCGPGSMTVEIAARVDPGEVVGIDVAPAQIARAKSTAACAGRLNLRFEAGSAYSLPFDSGRFDRVFSHALIEHLADPRRALRELHRVLAPAGVLGLCSPDWGGFLLSPSSP